MQLFTFGRQNRKSPKRTSRELQPAVEGCEGAPADVRGDDKRNRVRISPAMASPPTTSRCLG